MTNDNNNNNNNNFIVDLELTKQLTEEKIIEEIKFNAELNEGSVKLNGIHNEKHPISFPITFDKYDELKNEDIEHLIKQLAECNIESWDISSIVEVLYLDGNKQKIIEAIKEYHIFKLNNNNNEKEEDEQQQQQHQHQQDREYKKRKYSEGIIQLEFSDNIQAANILPEEDFIFEIDTKNFVLDFGPDSIYKNTRVIWHYNKNWNLVKSSCNRECKKKEIQDQHISLIEETVDLNYDTITLALKEREEQENQAAKASDQENNDGEKKAKNKEKRRITTFKYSQMGTGELYESVFIGGFPAFIYYDSNKKQFDKTDLLEESTRILAPPAKEECPYLPYEFENLEQINDIGKTIEDNDIGFDYLYYKGLEIVSKYNIQSKYKLRLVTINLILSYFQDRFATVHYLYPVGGNGSGKSSLAETFRAVAYRAVVMTDPTAPNLFRLLGVVEPAQCVIILEEADKIDKSTELMAVLKTGYSYYGSVPKINPYTLKQEFFFTYCSKIIVSERSLNHSIARGVNSRTFPINCFKGIAKHDIKETLNPTATGGLDNKELLQEIMDFRKLLLVYRLKHFKDPIPDLDIGVEGRDKELVKHAIQLFYKCKCEKQVTATLQKFLDIKNEKRNSAIEAILLPIIHSLVINNKIIQIASASIWEELIKEIPGKINENRPNQFHSYDYGDLYSTTISGIICDSFGAKIKHGNRRNYLVFDPEIIENLSKEENTTIEVKGIKKSEGVKGMKGSKRGTYDISTLLDEEEEETEINDNDNDDDDDDDSNSDENEDLPPSNDSTAFMPSLSTPEDKEEEI